MKGCRIKNDVIMNSLKPCPVCGKMPKVYRDYGYESKGFGAWCTIECKRFFSKPHLRVESGKGSWSLAVCDAGTRWNNKAAEE